MNQFQPFQHQFWRLGLLLVCFGYLSHRATGAPADVVWTNNAAGTHNWNVAANWEPNVVPGSSGENVYITNAGTYTITANVSATLARLVVGAVSGAQTVQIASSTLTLTNAVVGETSYVGTNAVLLLSGGTLSGTATVEIDGTMNWTGGTMTGIGTTRVLAGRNLNISGSGIKILSGSRTLENAGTVTWSGTGIITSSSASATINNSGLFDIQTDAELDWGIAGVTRFNNTGTLRKSAGAGTTIIDYHLNNSGIVDVQVGILNLDVQLTVNPGASFIGAGKCQSTASLVLNGAFSSQNLEVAAGTVTGSGSLASGTLAWLSGSLTSAGTLTIDPSAQFLISSGASKFLIGGFTLNNNGTVTWSGTGIITSSSASATINNSGLFDIRTDAELDWGNAGITTFNNTGTLRKSAGAGTTIIDYRLNNSGIVEAQIGQLTVTAAFAQAAGKTWLNGGGISSSLPLDLLGGELTGSGTFTGSVTNSATVRPGASPGILTISGNYVQKATGIIEIEIAGAAAGTEFDRLVVGGAATLGGTLNVVRLNDYAPALGLQFEVIQHASRTGSFGTVNGHGLNFYAGVNLDLLYGTGVALHTLADPTYPAISAIPNQTLDEDTSSVPLAITLSDLDTPGSSLQVSASSSDTALFPEGNLVLGGAGFNRTLTLNPALNLSGTATITVIAMDPAGQSGTSSFTVSVLPVNDKPAISFIPNRAILTNATAGPIAFTVSDPESPAETIDVTVNSSNLTLLPLAGIALGGTGTNRTLHLTPALDQSGTVNVTLTATDPDSQFSTRSFLLRVFEFPTTTVLTPEITLTNLVANAGEIHGYEASGNAGDRLRLRLFAFASTAPIDPVVEIYDSNWNVVAAFQDAGASILFETNLTASSVFRVTVRDRTEAAIGPYAIRLELLRPGVGGTLLPAGTFTQGRVAEYGETVQFRFEAAAGDLIRVGALAASILNLRLELVDPTGQVLTNQVQMNQLSIAVRALTTGTHSLWLTDGEGSRLGDFSLWYQNLTASAVPLVNRQPARGALDYPRQVDSYRIAAMAGDRFRLRVAADNAIGLRAEILDINGTPVATHTATGTLQLDWSPPTTGTYLVAVEAQNGTSLSPYSLTLTLLNQGASPLQVGVPFLTAMTNATQVDIFQFQAETADALIIRAASERWLKPTLEVFDSQWALVASATGEINVRLAREYTTPGVYHLVVSDNGGLNLSPYRVAVRRAPVIVTQPVAARVPIGAPAALQVQAQGSPTLLYQWQRNGVSVPEATNATLSIASVTTADAGTYTVVVQNEEGAAISVAVLLTLQLPVLQFADAFAGRVPVDTLTGLQRGDNRSATREAGEPRHSGKAGGRSVWFQWNAPANGLARMRTVGSTFDTLLAVYLGSVLTELTPVAADDDSGGLHTSEIRFLALEGVEYIVAVDGLLGANGEIVLEWSVDTGITNAPSITRQPASVSAGLTGTAVFEVQVTSAEPLEYQWVYKGQPLNGETNATLSIANVQFSHAGPYAVRVRDSNFEVVTPPRHLEVTSINQLLSEDKLEDLLGALPGSPALQNVRRRHAFASLSVGLAATHVLDNFGSSTELGEPLIAERIGGASRWVGIQTQDDGFLVIDSLGSSIDTLLAVYTGTSLADLLPIASDDNSAEDGRAARVKFQAKRNTPYYVAVDGIQGAQGNIRINWNFHGPPRFLAEPQDAYAIVGDTLTLQASVTGSPLPEVVWQHNGRVVAGANSPTLTLAGIQSAQAGRYRAVINNVAGNSFSREAVVRVDSAGTAIAIVPPPPQFVAANVSPLVVPFRVHYPGGLLEEVITTATSSNQQLLPAGSIGSVGTGALRYLTLTPQPGVNGLAVIHIQATSGRGSGSATFALAVGQRSRGLRLVGTSVEPGAAVAVPLQLQAAGDEQILETSIEFDPSLLALDAIIPSTSIPGAVIVTDQSNAGQGVATLAATLSAGQSFPVGTVTIATLQFTASATVNQPGAVVALRDSPLTRSLRNSYALPLEASFLNATVNFQLGIEADVAVRPTGDGNLTVADWVQVGRFAAGLDVPALGSEFQRVDCAPLSSKGDGQITVADWVQAGRYAAGLDSPQGASGPTEYQP